MSVRALVLTGFGINCEEETAAAFRLAGAEAEIVHLNRVLGGQASIHEHDLLAFPGGFSFGDDLGSGKVLAHKLTHRKLPSGRSLVDELGRFLADGKRVLGICNGFQILVKTGVLPFFGEAQAVTLTRNDSHRFEDRWVRLRVNPETRASALAGITDWELPVRHGEGKLVIGSDEARARIQAEGLDLLHYVDASGQPTDDYPDNPNGAELACAGLVDPSGQILGMMPHPEAYLSLYNHPAWTRRIREQPDLPEQGAGLRLFENLVAAVTGRVSPTNDRDPSDGARLRGASA